MGYRRGAEKYPGKFLNGICPALVDAGKFSSVEECKREGQNEASEQGDEWQDVAADKMAGYLKS